MNWHYRRDEQGDVEWYATGSHPTYKPTNYTIHVTAESRSSFPCGWGVKINGVFVQTTPSTGRLGKFSKHHAQPHDKLFRRVRDARHWCELHQQRLQAGALNPLSI